MYVSRRYILFSISVLILLGIGVGLLLFQLGHVKVQLSSPATTPATTTSDSSAPAADGTYPKYDATLTRIIDGDTIVISTGEHVRFVGMNAPEHDTQYGPGATAHLHQLIDGKSLQLQRDVSDKDKYGRILRFVWVGSENVDLQMVKDGWAKQLLIEPDNEYADQIKTLQQQAEAAHLGIWQQ
jgi:micrococcal nuclease